MTNGDWAYIVEKLQPSPNILKEIRLEFNIGNYSFGQTKIDYLGSWVTHKGIRTIHLILINK